MNALTHMRVPFCCTGNVASYDNECIQVLAGNYASEVVIVECGRSKKRGQRSTYPNTKVISTFASHGT